MLRSKATRGEYLKQLVSKLVVVAGTACLLTPGYSSGASLHLAAAQTGVIDFNVPAQPLSEALKTIGRQASKNVLFDPTLVEGKTSPELRGQMTIEEGIRRILAGTKLSFESVEGNTILLTAGPTGKKVSPGKTSRVGQGDVALHLAQTNTSEAGPSKSSYENSQDSHSGTEDSSDSRDFGSKSAIPEVLVKGSKSLNADIERTPDDIQPYVVLGQEEIRSSGALDVNDLLKNRLTMNYAPVSSNQSPGGAQGGESSFALRGLGSNQTLVLIDGRELGPRTIAGNALQPDLNTIPLSAIERIEILPTTATGIYGGGATGGVINVILKHNYSGLKASIGAEQTQDGGGETRRAEIVGGTNFNDGETNLFIRGAYTDGTQLAFSDRPFINGYLSRRTANQNIPATTPPLGATTNICSATIAFGSASCNQEPLVLQNGISLGSSSTFIPASYAGVVSDNGAALLANAGAYNQTPPANAQGVVGLDTSLWAPPRTESIAATVRQRLAKNVELFLDVSDAVNRLDYREINAASSFTLPSGSPGNPFAQDVIATVPLIGGNDIYSSRSSAWRLLAGVKATLVNDWSGEFDYSLDRSDFHQTYPTDAFLDAASNAVSTGTINVFRDPPTNAGDLASYLAPSSVTSPTHTLQNDETLRIAGPFARLPGGLATVSLVLENRQVSTSNFSETNFDATGSASTSSYGDSSSSTRSAYLEIRAPLVSEQNHIFGMHLLEVQLAGRYESVGLRTGIFTAPFSTPEPGSASDLHSLDPTVGLRFKPASDVMLRASYSSGYVAPGMQQLLPPSSVTFANFFGFTDPRRGGEPLGTFSFAFGGNPALQPERAESASAGLVLTPQALPDLRISTDWTRINKLENIISLALSQVTINNELLLPAGAITRAAPVAGDPFGVGAITGISTALLNATHAHLVSYDFSVSYDRDIGAIGRVGLAAVATRVVHNEVQFAPRSVAQEQGGTELSPSWNANATISWMRGGWGASWTAQYLDSFWLSPDHSVDSGQGASRVGSITYHDVAVSYNFGTSSLEKGNIWSGLDLRGGVKDVFNTQPRFLATFPSAYDPWGSPRMATYYMVITKSF